MWENRQAPRIGAALRIANKLNRRGVAGVLGALMSALPIADAVAQNSDLFRRVISVNEFVITGYDIQQQIKLIRFGAGRSVQNIEQVARAELIDEHLKLDEAERRGLSLSDEDLEKAFRDVAKNNGIAPDQFVRALANADVERSTFELKLRADLLWRDLVRARYGNRLQPNDDEVDAAMEQAASQAGVKIYDVKQVVVPLRGDAPQDVVRATFERALEIRQGLNGCGKVARYANEFGPPTGDIGKFTESQMPAQLREQVLKLSPGQSTRPLRSRQGLHLVILCDIVERKGGDRNQIQAILRQQKAQRFSESYLEELRRAAQIEE